MNGYRIYGTRDDNHPPEAPDGSIRLSPLAAPQGVSRARHLPDCETCVLFAPCMDAQRRNYEARQLRYPFARETCEAAMKESAQREPEPPQPSKTTLLVAKTLRELQPCAAPDIGDVLGVAPHTVRRHLEIMCKFNLAEVVGKENRRGQLTRIYRIKE